MHLWAEIRRLRVNIHLHSLVLPRPLQHFPFKNHIHTNKFNLILWVNEKYLQVTDWEWVSPKVSTSALVNMQNKHQKKYEAEDVTRTQSEKEEFKEINKQNLNSKNGKMNYTEFLLANENDELWKLQQLRSPTFVCQRKRGTRAHTERCKKDDIQWGSLVY